MLRGAFVSEPAIRLQLFVPASPRAGGLGMKGQGNFEIQDCRSRELATLFLQLLNQVEELFTQRRHQTATSQLPALRVLMKAPWTTFNPSAAILCFPRFSWAHSRVLLGRWQASTRACNECEV